MGRVTTIVATTVLLTAGASWIALGLTGPASLRAGKQLHPSRVVLERLAGAAGTSPDLVWLGDSTLMISPGVLSYPYILDRVLLAPAGLHSLVVATPGLDSFGYWTLAGRVCELHPAVVVVVATLRNFPPRPPHASIDLASEIDWGQVADAATLPYAAFGLTLPRILLARVLRTEVGEALFYELEGLHRNVQDASAWAWLGPVDASRSDAENLRRFMSTLGNRYAAYDQPLETSHPMVRFMEAAVDRLERCGARVLVLVTPIPWELLAENGHYDPARVEARIATFESAVVTHGGRLVDLHHALTRDGFRDADCHTTAHGAKALADRAAFPVVEALVERGVRAKPPRLPLPAKSMR